MTVNRFFDGVRRILGQRKSVVAATAAVTTVSLLAATMALVGAYYVGLERELSGAINEREASRVHAGVAALNETAEHLYLLQERLEAHRDGTAPLRLLEEHLDPEVGYSHISVDYAIAQVELSLHAPNAGSIARLQVAFEDDPSVLAVSLSPLRRNRESTRYEAEMIITLDEVILLAFPNLNAS